MEYCEGPYRACGLETIIVAVFGLGGAFLGGYIIISIIDKIIPINKLEELSKKNAFTEIVFEILTLALGFTIIGLSCTYIGIPARNIIFTWIANM